MLFEDLRTTRSREFQIRQRGPKTWRAYVREQEMIDDPGSAQIERANLFLCLSVLFRSTTD